MVKWERLAKHYKANWNVLQSKRTGDSAEDQVTERCFCSLATRGRALQDFKLRPRHTAPLHLPSYYVWCLQATWSLMQSMRIAYIVVTYCGILSAFMSRCYIITLNQWVLQKMNHQNMQFLAPPPIIPTFEFHLVVLKLISLLYDLCYLLSLVPHVMAGLVLRLFVIMSLQTRFCGRLCFRPRLVSAWIVAVSVIFRGNTTTMSCETSTTRWSDNSHIVVLTKLFGGDSCNIGCIPRSQHLASKICH